MASRQGRLRAIYVFTAIFVSWFLLFLAAKDVFDIGLLFGPCGFQQKYNLPCPTCGYTTAAMAYSHGRVFDAFYIQPAAALFCSLLLITGFLSLITVVFGVYFSFLSELASKIRIKYLLLVIFLIILSGWAVTLARALAHKN